MGIDLAALEAVLDRDAAAKLVPIALVVNAGTTNTGAIDPIAQMVAIANRRNIWLHVDGAYGLFGKLDPIDIESDKNVFLRLSGFRLENQRCLSQSFDGSVMTSLQPCCGCGASPGSLLQALATQ
jgi:cysteine sulfinate desulfinase/cysteine desulfurase-like protein